MLEPESKTEELKHEHAGFSHVRPGTELPRESKTEELKQFLVVIHGDYSTSAVMNLKQKN